MLEKYTITSPDPPLPLIGHQTIPEYLLDKAKEFTEKNKSYYAIDAITHEKRYFDKFDIESRKIASALYKLGLRKDDYVIYLPTEIIKLHVFLNGVWRANGVCRASYPDDDPATLVGRIWEANCAILLCDPDRVDSCNKAIANVNWMVRIITTEKCSGYLSIDDILENEDGQSCPPLEIKASDTAIVLCTSGTSGPPKGAVLTHSAALEHINIISHMPLTERNIAFSTATHWSGAVYTMSIMSAGKTAILTGNMTKEILWKTVDEMKPGFAFAFPTFLLYLVQPDPGAKKYDFSSLEYFLTGGSLVTPAIKQSLLQLPNVKDVVNGYGLSECGIVVANTIMRHNAETLTDTKAPDFAAGKPCSSTYVQIRNPETLEILGPQQHGEICIKNAGLFSGYFKNPEATKKAFVDGFFRTGDVGYFDEQGYIYVIDRSKEIFKYKGNHISPSDIENVIHQHTIVKEVCVVGVPDPEGSGTDVPRAFITINGNYSPDLADSIKEYVNGKLPDYKRLRGGLYIIPELPKGNTGKIARRDIFNWPL